MFKFKPLLWAAVASLFFVASCGGDDPEPSGEADPIASFQFEISTDNFLEVKFSNFSNDATSYSWDFGDNNTSTDESPTHVYAAGGEYTVTLTATGNGKTSNRSETFTLTDPNEELTILAGMTSKTWYLQREGIALGVGTAAGNNVHWSFGGVAPLGERPCVLNDAFTFHRDGTWEHETGGDLYIDNEGNGGWLGAAAAEGCYEESGNLTSTNGDDLSAFANGGNYTFEFDALAGTITLLGDGAYIGLANKTATGNNFMPLSSKTYEVFNLAEGDVADTLQMALVGTDVWNFYLVSYENPADLPAIPDVVSNNNDLPNETPAQIFNTFASDGAGDVDQLVATASDVTLTVGVDDPADAAATKVGQYARGTAPFADLKFQLDYDCQFDNFTTMSVDVYFPSTNDYSGDLSQQVDIFIADGSEDTEFWTTWELYQNLDQTAQDEWVTITFDLANALNREDLDLIGLKIGGENHGVDGTFFIRNFTFQ